MGLRSIILPFISGTRQHASGSSYTALVNMQVITFSCILYTEISGVPVFLKYDLLFWFNKLIFIYSKNRPHTNTAGSQRILQLPMI